MKRKEKIEKLKMLYELEYLVLYKEKLSSEDKARIKHIRKLVDSESVKNKGFDPILYKKLKAENPNTVEIEIAKMMGIGKDALWKGKKQYGLANKNRTRRRAK